MRDEPMIRRLRAAAERVFSPASILAAYAFGSRVWGRPRPDSDLDVGYYLDARQAVRPDPREEMALALALEDAVGFAIDLRDLDGAPLELRGRVLEDGVRIFSGDPAARVALERSILSRYHDYKPELEAMHALRLRRIAMRGL